MKVRHERSRAGWVLIALIVLGATLALTGCGLRILSAPFDFDEDKFFCKDEGGTFNFGGEMFVQTEQGEEGGTSIIIKRGEKEGQEIIIIEEGGEKKVFTITDEEELDVEVEFDRDYDEEASIVSVAGGDVHIGADQLVEGDVVAIGSDLTVEGEVVGDVVCVGGKLKILPTAIIHGEVVNVGGLAEISEEAVISGKTVNIYSKLPIKEIICVVTNPFTARLFGIGGSLITFAFILLFALLVIAIAPKHLDTATEAFSKDFLKVALAGVITLVLAPFVCLLLIIIIIGIPLAPLFILLLLIAGGFGMVAFSRVLMAKLFPKKEARKYATPILGLLLLYSPSLVGRLITLIPGDVFSIIGDIIHGLGLVVMLCVFVLGLGACVMTRFGRRDILAKVKPKKEVPAKA